MPKAARIFREVRSASSSCTAYSLLIVPSAWPRYDNDGDIHDMHMIGDEPLLKRDL